MSELNEAKNSLRNHNYPHPHEYPEVFAGNVLLIHNFI